MLSRHSADKGLVTHYFLFVINPADRLVQVLGITGKPVEVCRAAA